jgi:surface protein
MSVIINGKGTVGIRGGAVVGAPIITQFITTWKTDNAGTSTSTQISIPTTGAGYACSVDWGDGTSNSYSGTAPTMLHTYSVAGTYTVKISGAFPRILFNNGGDKLKLLTIENWGTGVWSGSMSPAFQGCTNLKINASDVPNFAAVTSTYAMFASCSGLQTVNASGWNLSNSTDNRLIFDGCTGLKDVNVTGWNLNTTSNIIMANVFNNCTSLSGLTGINTWNTSKVTTMNNMFANTKITSIDLSNWNTSSVTTTNSMFGTCTALTAITGLNTWSMSKVTDMAGMFNGSNKLTTLDLSNWNLSACTTMINMFLSCSLLKSVNTTGWVLNTTSTLAINSMFQNCTVLTGITGINSWNVRKVTTTSSMFASCNALPTLDLSNWNLGSCTTTNLMFNPCTSLTSIDMSNVNLSACTNMTSMFASSTNLVSVNATGLILNTTSTLDMNTMFASCTKLTGVTGINNWNTSKVTSTISMFSSCTSLSGITSLTGWDTSKVTNVYAMFYNCTGLQTLDLSGWNLSACTTYNNAWNTSMFFNCTGLRDLNVSGWTLNTTSNYSFEGFFRNCTSLSAITGLNTWNVSKSNYTGEMFYSCNNLSGTLDLSNWNLSASTSMGYMFIGCNKLTSIDTTGWKLNTTSNTTMGNMFIGCTALTGVTGIKNWDTSKVTNTTQMFAGCSNLRTLDLSGWNLSACTTFGNAYNGGMFAQTGLNNLNVSGWTLNTSTGATVSLQGLFSQSSSLSAVTGLNTWNVSRVNDFTYMVYTCSALNNLNVSGWTLSTLPTMNINMSNMLSNFGTKTITGLDTWNITRVTNFTSFLASTTLDTTTYSNMLIAWDILDPVNSLAFNGGGSKYNAAGQVARASLVTNDLWSITDGGLA